MPFKYASLSERLYYNSVLNPISDCWDWLGKKARNGYGVVTIYINGKTRSLYAHRISYAMHKGEIPEKMEIDHRCHNKLCINPDHLRAMTKTNNLRERRKFVRRVSVGNV